MFLSLVQMSLSTATTITKKTLLFPFPFLVLRHRLPEVFCVVCYWKFSVFSFSVFSSSRQQIKGVWLTGDKALTRINRSLSKRFYFVSHTSLENSSFKRCFFLLSSISFNCIDWKVYCWRVVGFFLTVPLKEK